MTVEPLVNGRIKSREREGRKGGEGGGGTVE